MEGGLIIAQEDREARKQYIQESYGKLQAKIIPADPAFMADATDREEIVGPYCRVSTMSGQQVESFEMQKLHYEEVIAKHPKWKLHRMYADEGISATSTKRRKEFKQLVQDCVDHKVSLVLTKSVTRFARNIVDCTSVCRELKRLNPPVGVLFETECINTLTQSSEIQLNMFALLAQSESETKSASVKWGVRNRFAANIPRIIAAYGYKRIILSTEQESGRDGERNETYTYVKGQIMIDEETAPIVYMIYTMYLEGYSPSEIIRHLEAEGIPSPTGNPKWYPATIMYILTNEKYMGAVTNQKTFVEDCFSHRSLKNVGQLPKYCWDNVVPPIVTREMWENVQLTLLRRQWNELLDTTKAPEIIEGIELYPLR